MTNKATLMNNQASASTDPATYSKWMWQSNTDPWSKSEEAEWSHFSDVENLIIEEAFIAKRSQAVLDDFYIDFKHSVQISTDDKKKQRPIKRQVNNRDNKHLREERFMPDPIAPGRSFGSQYGWVSPFIQETIIDLRLENRQLPSQDETIVPTIVEKAALGIIEEGKVLGRKHAAERMAKELLNQKDKGMKAVWICCVRLYTMEEFLYQKLNEIMRLIGEESQEEVWRSKVRTLGPYCLLLWDDPINKKPKTTRKILYRGGNLSKSQVDTYRNLSEHPDKYGSFQAFTSCSGKRAVAENFGKDLFIMEVNYAFTADLNKISVHPEEEEEELLFPGVCFTVQRVEYDKTKNQHLIYISLKQRFNESEIHEASGHQQTMRYSLGRGWCVCRSCAPCARCKQSFRDNALRNFRYDRAGNTLEYGCCCCYGRGSCFLWCACFAHMFRDCTLCECCSMLPECCGLYCAVCACLGSLCCFLCCPCPQQKITVEPD